jgi:hypothetical protein
LNEVGIDPGFDGHLEVEPAADPWLTDRYQMNPQWYLGVARRGDRIRLPGVTSRGQGQEAQNHNRAGGEA